MKFKRLLGVGLSAAMIFNMTGVAGAEVLTEEAQFVEVVEEDASVETDGAIEVSEETEAEEIDDEALGAPASPAISSIPGTVTTLKKFSSSYDYVTGFATAGITDRAKYVGTEAHRKVATEREFLDAILDAQKGTVKIIELTENLDFGYNHLAFTTEEAAKYSFCSKYKEPSVAPALKDVGTSGYTNLENKEKGVSKLTIEGVNGLTIFSKDGKSISRAEVTLSRSNSAPYTSVANDVAIRNIHFRDMWQWDELDSSGKSQKAVGWTNLKINGATNIWIDHCTFDPAYDGNIDLENGATNVSITWCKIGQSADEATDPEGAVYKSVMDMEKLYQEGKLTSGLYLKYRKAGATPEEIMAYAAYHDKCHLVGSGDKDCIDFVNRSTGDTKPDSNNNVKLTLAYNHYLNIGQRVPLVRLGTAHMYNCFVDNTSHYAVMQQPAFTGAEYKFYRCLNARDGGSIAADTCVFKGVDNPIIGTEYQGQDTSNMEAPFTIYFKNAQNRNLVVNSRVTNNAGETYEGSSWDNNGENQFNNAKSTPFSWKDKTTINNWAWSREITNIDGYHKEELEKLKRFGADGKLDASQAFTAFPFEFKYDTEGKLPYEYYVLPLNDVESVVSEKAGCIKGGSWSATKWCTAANPSASAGAEGDTLVSKPSTGKNGKVEGVSFTTANKEPVDSSNGVVTVNATVKVILPGTAWKLSGCVDQRISDVADTTWNATSGSKDDDKLLKKYAKVKADVKNNRTVITTVANKKVPGGVYAVKLEDGTGNVIGLNIECVEFDKNIKKKALGKSYEEDLTVSQVLAYEDDYYSANVGLTLIGSSSAPSGFNSRAIVWQTGSGKNVQALKKGEVVKVVDKKGVIIAFLTVTDEGTVKVVSGSAKGKVALTATVNGKAYKTVVSIK